MSKGNSKSNASSSGKIEKAEEKATHRRQKGSEEINPQEDLPKLSNKVYEAKLAELQVELVMLQEWIKAKGLRVVVIFEGRDAAGKGGTIKRMAQRLNPRVCRVVALTSG
jgi:polyphosphate kinase 2 (PPK2 family)